MGQSTSREWRRLGPLPSHAKKVTRGEGNQTPEDARRRKFTWGGIKEEKNGDGGTNGGRHPRDRNGPGHRPREERGGKRTRDKEAGAGMRRGVQRQATEAGGWRVGEKSRCTT